MYVFEQMYRSPRGFRIREYEAETCEDGKREAREYCDRPGYDQIATSFYRKPAGVAALSQRRVEHDFVLAVATCDEVSVQKLADHRLLVDGCDEIHVFKAPFEVSDLVGVLADLEEAQKQVEGRGFH